MNSINCIIRLLEIPIIKLYQNKIPFAKFKVELGPTRNHKNNAIIEAQVWGDLAYDIKKYYHVNDYLIIEGYFSISSLLKDSKLENKLVKLYIYRFYPYFVKKLENKKF